MSTQPTTTATLLTCAARLHTLGDPSTANTLLYLARDYGNGKLERTQVQAALHRLLDTYENTSDMGDPRTPGGVPVRG
jgi:hypothetical protein